MRFDVCLKCLCRCCRGQGHQNSLPGYPRTPPCCCHYFGWLVACQDGDGGGVSGCVCVYVCACVCLCVRALLLCCACVFCAENVLRAWMCCVLRVYAVVVECASWVVNVLRAWVCWVLCVCVVSLSVYVCYYFCVWVSVPIPFRVLACGCVWHSVMTWKACQYGCMVTCGAAV